MAIIILGPPGSGKGTQAKEISEYFDLPHICLGELLRKESKKTTARAKSIRSYMHKGELIPDNIISGVVQRHLPGNGFVLDGFPRSIAQAKLLEVLLQKKGMKENIKIIGLKVREKILIARLKNRGMWEQRLDDRPQVIKNRIRVYQAHTRPLMQYYKKKESLKIINGEGTKRQVYLRIKKALCND